MRSIKVLSSLTMLMLGLVGNFSGCKPSFQTLMLQVTNGSNAANGPVNQVAVSAPAAGDPNPTMDIAIVATQGGSFQSQTPSVFIGPHLYNDAATVEKDANDSSRIIVHVPQADIKIGAVPIEVIDGDSSI